MGNALFGVYAFDALTQMYPDVLHVWLLGIFLHLFGATLHLMKSWLARWVDVRGQPICGPACWKRVLDRLTSRLEGFGSLTHTLSVSKWCSRACHRVDEHTNGGDPSSNAANTSAAENSRLACALATELAGLLDPEIRAITQHYASDEAALHQIRLSDAHALLAEAQALAAGAEHKAPQAAAGGASAAVRTGSRKKGAQEQDKHAPPPVARPPSNQPSSRMSWPHNAVAGTGGRPAVAAARPDSHFDQEEAKRRAAHELAHMRRYTSPSEDPMLEIERVWLSFLDVYLQFRQPQSDNGHLEELRIAIAGLKHAFVRVFPNKGGQHMWAWAFIKEHELDYLKRLLLPSRNVSRPRRLRQHWPCSCSRPPCDPPFTALSPCKPHPLTNLLKGRDSRQVHNPTPPPPLRLPQHGHVCIRVLQPP